MANRDGSTAGTPMGRSQDLKDLGQGDCVSAFLFVPEPPGEKGGSLKFVKRESLFKWAVRPPFPRQRAQSPSASDVLRV